MSQISSFEEYRQTVEHQAKTLLDKLAYITTGNFDVEIEIPEGVDVLTDLGVAIAYLVDDFREALAEQDRIRFELEERVAARTKALEIALDEMQATQQRYIQKEWAKYTTPKTASDEQLTQGEVEVVQLCLPTLTEAIEQEQVVSQTEADNQAATLALPISYAGELIGVLGFSQAEQAAWSADDLAAVESVVEQVGLALENQRLFDQTQLVLEETQTLYDLAAKLNVASTMQEILTVVAEPAIETGAKAAHLLVMHQSNKNSRLECVATWSKKENSELVVGGQYSLAELPFGEFVTHNRLTLISNTAADLRLDDASQQACLAADVQALVTLPLVSAERHIGAVSVEWSSPHLFSEQEQRLYRTLMVQTAVAVNNRLLFEQIETALSEAESLYNLSNKLSRASSLDDVLYVAITPALESGATHAVLLTVETNEEQKPEWGEVLATWQRDPGLGFSLGTRYHLSQFTEGRLLIDSPNTPLFFGDFFQDERLGPDVHPIHRRLKAQAIVLLPLALGKNWVGVIGIYWPTPQQFQETERRIYRSIAEQTAVVVNNRVLFERTETALTETETLYSLSGDLSAVTTVDEALETAIFPVNEICNALMFAVELNDSGRPEWANLIATWEAEELAELGQISVESRYYLPDFVLSELWFANSDEPILFEAIQSDARFDPAQQAFYQQMNAAASITVPLTLGGRWIGLLVLNWPTRQNFAEKTVRLYRSIGAQTAVVLNNLLLLEEAQERAVQLEIIAKIEMALSQASTENEIVSALAPAISDDSVAITLNYIEVDQLDYPAIIRIVAIYRRGRIVTDSPFLDQSYRLEDFPMTDLWIDAPDQLLLIEDVTDSRYEGADVRKAVKEFGFRALAQLPLVSGGRWHGSVTFTWTKPHKFIEREQFILRRILESVGAVVAGRRSFLALESDRRRVETVARISTRMSLATNEQAILAATTELSERYGADLVALDFVELNKQQIDPTSLELVAVQNGQGQPLPANVFLRHVNYIAEHFALAELLFETPTDPLFVENVFTNPRYRGGETRAFMTAAGLSAFIGLPLKTGEQWQGLLFFYWSEPQLFDLDMRSLFAALRPRAADVVASRRAYLVAETTRRLTERLYNAGRRINESTDLQEIVAAVAEAGGVPVINRALLLLFQMDIEDEIEQVLVAANWHSGHGVSPTPVETQFDSNDMPILTLLLTEEPLFFGDIWGDNRLSSMEREQLQEFDIQAMAVLPLWAGLVQRGCILLQAEHAHEFTRQEIRPYVALSRQAAVAIENQRLLRESQAALAEVEAVQRRYTRTAWENYRARQANLLYEKDSDIAPADDGDLEEDVAEETKLIPLKLRNEQIGVLGLVDELERAWSEEEIALVEAIAEQVAQAAENLRLLDATQKRAARETRVNEIGDKIQAASTLEEAVQIAIKEIGMSLQVPYTTVQLKVE